MREMEIPPFPRKFDNPDLGDFLRQRLSQTSVLWPEQAIPLVGRSADALITPSIDAIESRPPAENTAKKQRGRPFKAGRSGCRRALLYGDANAIARHGKKSDDGIRPSARPGRTAPHSSSHDDQDCGDRRRVALATRNAH